MSTVKKLIVLGTTLMLCLSMVGCGNKNVEGNLSDLMAKIYKDIPEDKLPMYLENREVTKENVESYLGTKDIEFKEALASESMVGSVAYSVVLVRAKEGADIEKLKKQIKENVDPRKWICVGVENVIVENIGDLVIVILSDDLGSQIQKGFENLK